jgi:cytosine/adenosine deaminase-related metal-dependent hydrolase
MLKGAELLLSGVTVNDMFYHANMGSLASLGAVAGLEAMGLRAVVSFGAEDLLLDPGGPEPQESTVAAALDEHEALADCCARTDLIGFRLGIGSVIGESDELLAASAAARRRGWAVHTHLAEFREEVVQARLRWGNNTVERAAEVSCSTCRCWQPTASGSARPTSGCWRTPG